MKVLMIIMKFFSYANKSWLTGFCRFVELGNSDIVYTLHV